jgi:hypothetical protein
MSGIRIAGYNLPIWIIIVIMIGAGSLTITVPELVEPMVDDWAYNSTSSEIEQPLTSNSIVKLRAGDGMAELEVMINAGDLIDNTYDVFFFCNDPAVNKIFADGIEVIDGEGDFEEGFALDDGTYSGCDVRVGSLSVEFPVFKISGVSDSDADIDVPTTGSFAFTGSPVHFDTENPGNLWVSGSSARAGVKVITSQQIRVDILSQAADTVTLTIPLRNESEDSQIISVKVTVPQNVLVDVRQGVGTSGVRLAGQNQWLMAVNDNSNSEFQLDVIPLQVQAFYMLVEVTPVG